MNIIIYLQCDARFNDYMLKRIGDKTVIEHTIERIKKIGMYKIISSVYKCSENGELIRLLKSDANIEVIESDESHVTKRFIDAVYKYEGYVIRVCGDQALLDYNITRKIISVMGEYDFYYDETLSNCVIPDIVSIKLLRLMKNNLYNSSRYFHSLLNDKSVSRLRISVNPVLHKCRVNDFVSYIFVKNIIEKELDIYELSNDLISQLNSTNSNLYTNGMLCSWLLGNTANEYFYNIDREINPWWCESAVNFVREKIQRLDNIRVFEWGAGNSTFFWSRYSKEVVSIEYDKEWFEKIRSVQPKNSSIKYYELVYDGEYCRSINNEDGQWDIVLIDGRDRVRCAKQCVSKLTENGVIIWDNSDREYYKEGFDFLKSNGFKQIELSGLIWGLPGVKDYTSIFYRYNNIFDI